MVRTNAADWRTARNLWDELGYGEILSDANRAAIARGKVPRVDDAWIAVFPEDAGLMRERISMHLYFFILFYFSIKCWKSYVFNCGHFRKKIKCLKDKSYFLISNFSKCISFYG